MKNLKFKIATSLLFLFVMGICFAIDSFLGIGSGILLTLANGPAAVDQETINYLKNAFKGFDFTDPATAEALKNSIKDGMQNGQEKLVEKLDALIEQQKNYMPKPSETGPNKIWCHAILTEHEQKWDVAGDKNAQFELNRIGFNRYMHMLYKLHKGQLSADEQKTLQQLKEDITTKHGLQTSGTSTEGGYTVPTPMFDLLVDELRESGLFMSELTIIRMNRRYAVAPVLNANGHPAPSIKEESTSAAAKRYAVGNIAFGTTEFRVKDNGLMIPWTAEMDFDSIVDIFGLIKQYVIDWFGIYGDDILFRGNGQAGNLQIKGLYELTGMTDYELPTNAFDSIDLDAFIVADGQMRSVDKKGMKRYMSPSVWSHIKKDKGADGHYILSSIERSTNMIEGKPVVESDSAYSMNESGANKSCVIQANLKKGFLALLNGMGIEFAQSNVASFVDGAITRHSMQENLTVVRVNMPFDIVHPFPSRYVNIKTKA